MDGRINKLEQQIIERNMEINDVQNKEIGAVELVKAIATRLEVQLVESALIPTIYKIKVVIEFASITKKSEIIGKVKRHRIEEPSPCEGHKNENYIYINDQLTATNRRLLWLAKTKAKESGWKYIWVKNGMIFARKSEHTNAILINNNSDIDLICQSEVNDTTKSK
ncbi:uncharacterized protein LOC142239750 [Haematobia irritans]|uniref:uncharacterized protein LOC142239750 n=1 Tax=Haematobia irritans TaxID=7368 RepID=UPI003F4F9C9D